MKERNRLNQKLTMITAVFISMALIFGGILMNDLAILGNLIIIAGFITAVPYFSFKYSRYVWVKSLEEEFPNFIRDLADSVRSMPLPEALGVISKSNYGNLTPEIEAIHNRLTWGTPFVRALEIFEKSVKESKIISEALSILRQSYESGGSMVSTLESISRDLLMLREADQERISMLRQHIFIMYAIFFMFVGIAILIIIVMVPMIDTQMNIELGGSPLGSAPQMVFSNPCEGPRIIPFPCGYYMVLASIFGVSFEKIGAYYLALFFSAVLIQGVFIGLITGQLSESSVVAGVKHSLIMMISTISVFMFLTRAGFILI